MGKVLSMLAVLVSGGVRDPAVCWAWPQPHAHQLWQASAESYRAQVATHLTLLPSAPLPSLSPPSITHLMLLSSLSWWKRCSLPSARCDHWASPLPPARGEPPPPTSSKNSAACNVERGWGERHVPSQCGSVNLFPALRLCPSNRRWLAGRARLSSKALLEHGRVLCSKRKHRRLASRSEAHLRAQRGGPRLLKRAHCRRLLPHAVA